MPDITAFADAFRDWEGLIGALNENGTLVPGHEALKADLAATLEQAKVLKVQQESIKNNVVAATDRFLDAVEEGKGKARKIRGFIVSVLGTQHPALKLFGIAIKRVPNPNNRRRRAKKPATPDNPQAPGTPTGHPPVAVKAAE